MLESSKPFLFQEHLRFTRRWPTELSLHLEGLTVPFLGQTLNSHWFQNEQHGVSLERTKLPWTVQWKTTFNNRHCRSNYVSLKPIIAQLLLVSNLTMQSAAGAFLSPKGRVNTILTPAFTQNEAACPDCKAQENHKWLQGLGRDFTTFCSTFETGAVTSVWNEKWALGLVLSSRNTLSDTEIGLMF